MRKVSIVMLLLLVSLLSACSDATTMHSYAKGENAMTTKNIEPPRDGDGSINPAFYISHAQCLTNGLWKTRIDDEVYTMTFSNLSRRWINVYIYKGTEVDRTKVVFEGDTNMEQFETFAKVVQIVPEEKGKEFLPGYKYMLVSRDTHGKVAISMRKDAYVPLVSSISLSNITGKSDNISWELVYEPNRDELQYLTLTRSQAAGTGLEWFAQVEPEGYLKRTIDVVNYKNPNMPGSSGEHKWRYKALKDGVVTITLTEAYGMNTSNPKNTQVLTYEIKDGIITEIKREVPSLSMMNGTAQQQSSEWVCSCGTRNNNKFCTECGRPRPVDAQ